MILSESFQMFLHNQWRSCVLWVAILLHLGYPVLFFYFIHPRSPWSLFKSVTFFVSHSPSTCHFLLLNSSTSLSMSSTVHSVSDVISTEINFSAAIPKPISLSPSMPLWAWGFMLRFCIWLRTWRCYVPSSVLRCTTSFFFWVFFSSFIFIDGVFAYHQRAGLTCC